MVPSSDGDVFAFALVRDGVVPALFVLRGLTVQAQLAHVLRVLGQPLREPRCMSCGGQLVALTKEAAAGRVPPRSLAFHDRFGSVPAASRSSGTARTGSASSGGYGKRRSDRPAEHAAGSGEASAAGWRYFFMCMDGEPIGTWTVFAADEIERDAAVIGAGGR
jgi:hypothetical protein